MRFLVVVATGLALLLVAVFVVWMRAGASVGRGSSASAPASAEGEGRRADWRAEVKLEQLSERNPDYEASRLTVVLRDSKGREVETPDVELELGGVPLKYAVGQGNYYDRHPFYRLPEDPRFRFAADTPYELAVRRANEPLLPLASIRTPKPLSPESFRLPASHPSDRDLVISWTGLAEPAELLVHRTLTSVDERGSEISMEGGPYADDVLRRRIGAGGLPLPDGSTTIPASYLRPTGSRVVTSVGLEITARSDGRFLCSVVEPSTVTATRRIVLRVDVTAPRAR